MVPLPIYAPPPKRRGCGIAAIIGGAMVAAFLGAIIVFGVFLFRVLEDAHIRNIPWQQNPLVECVPGQAELPHWAQAGPPRGHWNRNARTYENLRLGIRIDLPWDWNTYCDDCISRFGAFDGAFALTDDVFVELAASRDIAHDNYVINLLVLYERLDDSSMTAEGYVQALNELRAQENDAPVVMQEDVATIGAYDWHSFRLVVDDHTLPRPVHMHWFMRVQGGFAQIIQVLYFDGYEALEDILEDLFSELEPDDMHGELRPLSNCAEFVWENRL